MSKAVMLSIRPKWAEKIANGEKTIEVRKTRPKLHTPFKCYIYCTNIRPFLVWGDVFRGDWFTEFTRITERVYRSTRYEVRRSAILHQARAAELVLCGGGRRCLN